MTDQPGPENEGEVRELDVARVVRVLVFTPFIQTLQTPDGELSVLCFHSPNGDIYEFPMAAREAQAYGRKLAGLGIQTAPAGGISALEQAGILRPPGPER